MTASPDTEIRTEPEAAVVEPVPVSAQALRLALGAVMPHACTDDDLPSLKAVKLELRSGVVYAAATDRYTLAVAKIPAAASAVSAPDADALLGLGRAAELLRRLEGVTGAILLGISQNRVSADTCDGRAAWWTTVPGDPGYVDWRQFLHGFLIAPAAEMGGKFGLNGSKQARLDLAGEPLRYESSEALSFRWTGSGSPMTLVTRGDWFIAMICPARISDSSATDPADAWAGWTALTAPGAEAVGAK